MSAKENIASETKPALPAPKKKTMRTLFIIVVILVILVPLGILATAPAWGESEILNPAFSFWQALLPDYGTDGTFGLDPNIGYYLAAIIGVGVILGVLLTIWKIKVRKEVRTSAIT